MHSAKEAKQRMDPELQGKDPRIIWKQTNQPLVFRTGFQDF